MRLAVYLGSACLVLVATFVILRLVVRRDYLRKGRLTPISSAAEYLMCILWASFSYVYLPAGWPEIHVGLTLRVAGWAFAIPGLLTMLFSLGWLGLRRAHGLQADLLVQSGPYRLSRNPQILGFGIGMLGFALLWPSWHMLLSMTLLVFLAHLMVLTEEEYLLARYAESYLRYCQRVPRYIGIPKRNQ